MSNTSDKFWMVCVPGRGAPNVRHDAKADAIAEAKRLAQRERASAYVLETVGAAIPQDAVWAEIGAEEKNEPRNECGNSLEEQRGEAFDLHKCIRPKGHTGSHSCSCGKEWLQIPTEAAQ